MELTGLRRTKVCRVCKENKLLLDFYSHRNTSDKLRSECKVCWNKSSLDYYFNNKQSRVAQRKDYHYRSKYGLTKEEVEKLKEDQNFKCMICEDEVNLVVDHCHKTGKVRSLLCNLCNQGLGSFKDDPKIIDKASAYLRS